MKLEQQKAFLLRLFDSPVTSDPKIEAFRFAYSKRLKSADGAKSSRPPHKPFRARFTLPHHGEGED